MCDTVAIVGDDGVLFAKNSDRDPNEAQLLEWHPATAHRAGAEVACTWITIPQAAATAAVLLSRPFWMWGAEMGANEHGVVIGNEAVFTTEPLAATGLTGMDLVRLALERSHTADDAVGVIVDLLETHGQGGGCGFEDPSFTYHNSFLVADGSTATVLETAGRRWATEVVSGARSISNGLTIPGFAERHDHPEGSRSSACSIRRQRTESLARGATTPSDLARILRDHGGRPWPDYARERGTIAMPCMHGGGQERSPVTAGSWIAALRPGGARHWATATSSPCLSVFVPVAVDEPVDLGPAPGAAADASLWWTHERLHRRVMADPARLGPAFLGERDRIEQVWFSDAAPRSAVAFARRRRDAEQWLAALPPPESVADVRPAHTRSFWTARDRAAGLLDETAPRAPGAG